MTAATTLLIEPFAGLGGDMLLAALLDLRDPRFTLETLRELAEAMVPGEARMTAEVAWRGSLSGLMLTVETDESGQAPHRRLSDCLALIERSPLSERARLRAGAVFRRIAEAEARVHGTTTEKIHFHEVGAVDALIDVCGAALALERLGVERVCSTPPLAGDGTVQCAHGEMPVPAPGTAEIMRGLPMVLGGGGERLTPTGAALLAEFVHEFEPPELFVAARIGYAAGHRDPRTGPPNILRVQLGESRGAPARTTAWLLECNLDDMTGEELAFLVQGLREAGALEAWTAPVQMKKERPGVVVSALCRAELRTALEDVLFAHSTTLGVRWLECRRTELEREMLELEVLGRKVRVKRRLLPGVGIRQVDLSPEFEDLAALARDTGKGLRELEREVLRVAELSLRGSEAE